MSYNYNKKVKPRAVQIHSSMNGVEASSDSVSEAFEWISERLKERPNNEYGIYVLHTVVKADVNIKLETHDVVEG